MDAFYASVEQRDHPELRGRPVIVGAVSHRGVVSAASYEARAFGVRSAMPGFRARELCPDGVFLRGDMKKYARISEQVHRIFEQFTPLIEPIALDEAFLDITGSLRLFGDPLALGRELKERVKQQTGLVVSCGIAGSKLVAKIACSLGKPDGLFWVKPGETRQLLDPLPVRALWGVGPVAEKRLRAAGYQTLADIANAEPKALRRAVGERAEALAALARGEDDRSVEPTREAKSYGEENTFERDVLERVQVSETLTSHAFAAAARLRRDGVAGRTVTVKWKLGRARGLRTSRSTGAESEPNYPLHTRSRTLPEATADGRVIRRVALGLWDAARVDEPVRLLGISVSQLEPLEAKQLSLFARTEQKLLSRGDALGPVLDRIRARFGEHAIGVGVRDPDKLTPGDRKKRGV
jgi:DNA polymerase-4